MEDESYSVVIEGGSPWGFGIQGGLDFRSPLRVKMVTPGGRAHKSGLVTGDYITAINGQETKPLKHMQSQQLIKKSTQKVELTCVKLRPGLISPAITTSSFSFPSRVANGSVSQPSVSRSPVISNKPITRPPPPPVVVNGHNRQSSLGTPSESTASSSPHSCGGGESYEGKFLGMDTYCMDKSHPMPDVEVQESVDVVQVKEEPLVSYDLGGVESSPQEVIEEVAMAVEVKDELHASYNLEPVEEPLEEPVESDQQEALVQQGVESSPQEVVEEVAMAVQVKDELHASYNLEPVEEPLEEPLEEPVESDQQEALVQQGMESSPQEVVEEVAMAVQVKDELHASYNLEPVEEPLEEPVESDQQEALVQQGVESSPQEVVEEVAMAVQVKDELHASYNLEPVEEPLEEPVESDQQEALVQQTEEIVNDESAVSETVEAIVMTPKDVDITCDVQTGEAPVLIVEAAEAIVMKDTPIDITCDDPAPIVEAAEAVVIQETPIELNCDTAVEVEVKKSSRRASPSVNKMDLVNIITHAAERKRRESRDSSVDSQDPTKGHSSPEKSPQISKKQSPKETSPKQTSGKSVMSASKPPKAVRALSIEAKEDTLPVAKQALKQTENPVAAGIKEPGWYKQMFQDFQNTVEETYPGSSSGPETEYVYDERGLKVRRDSLPRNTEPLQPERETAPSPDDPVYVYDERGLRVRADSLSKVQSSTSPEAEKMRTEQRPKSANAPKLSVDSGVTTDDVLSANKRQTGLKASQFSTDGSRDYWNQKDQDQKEFEEHRRQNSQELHVRQSSGSSDYSTNMTSMHPLLQAGKQENKEKPAAADGEESERVFNRIDASKLQGALENASMLNKLEQEGVAPELLPGVAKGAQEEKNKPKEKQLKPPPGRKGKALYTFDGQTAKELSFKKGDIVDLLHTVDANWLQGSLGGVKGIFPATYIQVISLEEYRELISPEPKPRAEVGRAKALFDFQGQSPKELSFSKDDELIITKKIDDNWYEGFHGDKEGIFPVLYVKEL